MKFIIIDTTSDRWWAHVLEDSKWIEYYMGKEQIWSAQNPPLYLLDKDYTKYKISKSFRMFLEQEKMIQRMR